MRTKDEILKARGFIRTNRVNSVGKELPLDSFRNKLKNNLNRMFHQETAKPSGKIHIINTPAGTGKSHMLYEIACDYISGHNNKNKIAWVFSTRYDQIKPLMESTPKRLIKDIYFYANKDEHPGWDRNELKANESKMLVLHSSYFRYKTTLNLLKDRPVWIVDENPISHITQELVLRETDISGLRVHLTNLLKQYPDENIIQSALTTLDVFIDQCHSIELSKVYPNRGPSDNISDTVNNKMVDSIYERKYKRFNDKALRILKTTVALKSIDSKEHRKSLNKILRVNDHAKAFMKTGTKYDDDEFSGETEYPVPRYYYSFYQKYKINAKPTIFQLDAEAYSRVIYAAMYNRPQKSVKLLYKERPPIQYHANVIQFVNRVYSSIYSAKSSVGIDNVRTIALKNRMDISTDEKTVDYLTYYLTKLVNVCKKPRRKIFFVGDRRMYELLNDKIFNLPSNKQEVIKYKGSVGINKYSNYDVCVLLGAFHIPRRILYREVSRDCIAKSISKQKTDVKIKILGQPYVKKMEVYKNIRLRSIVRQYETGEIIQALNRIRPILEKKWKKNKKAILIFNNEPLENVKIDRLTTIEEYFKSEYNIERKQYESKRKNVIAVIKQLKRKQRKIFLEDILHKLRLALPSDAVIKEKQKKLVDEKEQIIQSISERREEPYAQYNYRTDEKLLEKQIDEIKKYEVTPRNKLSLLKMLTRYRKPWHLTLKKQGRKVYIQSRPSS